MARIVKKMQRFGTKYQWVEGVAGMTRKQIGQKYGFPTKTVAKTSSNSASMSKRIKKR